MRLTHSLCHDKLSEIRLHFNIYLGDSEFCFNLPRLYFFKHSGSSADKPATTNEDGRDSELWVSDESVRQCIRRVYGEWGEYVLEPEEARRWIMGI